MLPPPLFVGPMFCPQVEDKLPHPPKWGDPTSPNGDPKSISPKRATIIIAIKIKIKVNVIIKLRIKIKIKIWMRIRRMIKTMVMIKIKKR